LADIVEGLKIILNLKICDCYGRVEKTERKDQVIENHVLILKSWINDRHGS
jgi:hypothetical protein